MFENLRRDLESRGIEFSFEPIPDEVLAGLRLEHPDIPDEYVVFLQEWGQGYLGEGDYTIFRGVTKPSDIYDSATAERLGNLLIFGVDLCGICDAFDPENDWEVVSIDNPVQGVQRTGLRFAQFIETAFQ